MTLPWKPEQIDALVLRLLAADPALRPMLLAEFEGNTARAISEMNPAWSPETCAASARRFTEPLRARLRLVESTEPELGPAA